MSVQVMSWAWEQKCTPTEKFVLLTLADHADHKGLCWPGMDGVAKKTGLTRRTVVSSINSLSKKGLISVENRTHGGMKITNVYRLNAPVSGCEAISPRCENDAQKSQESPKYGCETVSLGCENDDTLRCEIDAPRCETVSHKPSIKQTPVKQTSKTNTREEKPSRFDPKKFLLERCPNSQLVDDYLSLRKKRRAEGTLTAMQQLERRVEKSGRTWEDVLGICCYRGWTSFEESWVSGGKNGKATSGEGLTKAEEYHRKLMQAL